MPIRPMTVRLDPDTARLLRRYPGESPTVVIRRALLLLATADGHTDAAGRAKRRQA